MKGLEITAYTKGYYDGMSYDKKYPQLLRIMGYKLEQILELIIKNEGERSVVDKINLQRNIQRNKMATEVNHKFEYCGYEQESSDRDFLGFIYARLNTIFGERPDISYMKRLEKIIDEMPGKIRIGCDCTVGDKCPQGRMGMQTRCSIWKDNQK